MIGSHLSSEDDMQSAKGLPEEQSTAKNASPIREITVTITSSMSKSVNFTINIATSATVSELKYRCSLANFRLARQVFVYEGKELKNDNSPISDYGMTSDCTVRVVARMEAGRKSTITPASNMAKIIFFTPFLLPEPSKSMANLRKTIRGLNNHGNLQPGHTTSTSDQQAASTQKSIEHTLTRKRMQEIMEKRRVRRVASKSGANAEIVGGGPASASVAQKPQDSGNSHGVPGIAVVEETRKALCSHESADSLKLKLSKKKGKVVSLPSSPPSTTTAASSVRSSGSTASISSSAVSTSSSQSTSELSFDSSKLLSTPGTLSFSSTSLSSNIGVNNNLGVATPSSSISSISPWSGMNNIDTGSICGSISHSPLGSAPGTPPSEEMRFSISPSATATDHKASNVSATSSDLSAKLANESKMEHKPMTRKEMLSYFDPPETKQELDMMRRIFYDPPQNREELVKMKESMSAVCGVCRRRLPVAVRSIVCACGTSFCNRHREEHNCSVDYKHTERGQLQLQNPKIGDGGLRKGRLADDEGK